MFNIKQFVNRITDNKNERDGGGAENSASFVDHEEQHSAEGFLCPPCMKAFPSAEALEEHYNKTHVEDVSTPDSNANVEMELLRQEIQSLQFTLADEKANSAELKKEMLKIQADLNAKDMDSSSFRSQEKEFEESKSLMTSEVTLLRQQLADSLEQISILRKEKDAMSHSVGSSTQENEELKKEVANLKAQLAHRNSIDDAEVLRQELVSVQKLMNQLTVEKEKEVEILNSKLLEAQQRPNEASDEHKEALMQAHDEIKTLREAMGVKQSEQNDKFKKVMEDLSSKEADIAEMKNLLHSKEQKFEMVQKECDQMKSECDRLREQHTELCNKIETGEGAKAALEGLQKENELLKKNLNDVQSQNKELNQQLHDLQLKLEKSLSDQKQLKSSLDAKTEDCLKLEQSQVKLNTRITAKDKCIDDLAQGIKKLESAAESNVAQLKTIQSSLKSKEEEVINIGKVNKDLLEKVKTQEGKMSVQNKQIETIQTMLKESEGALKECHKTLDLRTSDLKEAQEKINNLQESLSDSKVELKQTVENFENEVKSLQATVLENKATLEKRSKEMSDLKQTMQEELSNLRNKISSLDGELEQKKTELAESSHTINELTEQRNEADQRMQLLQLKIDEIIQQKLELEQTCVKNEEEKSQLLEKLITSETEVKSLNSTIDEVSRKKDDAMAALQELGRENQSLQIEIAKIQGRKWADDSNVSNCSSCRKEFTLTFRKHHCRHCGQIFCSECSSKSASVPSSKKPVRVCDPCYTKLTSQ